MPKNAEKYFCEKCNFVCSKKSNYDKHLLTLKHKNTSKYFQKMPKNAENNDSIFDCICGKVYKHRQSLTNHKKICNELNKATTEITNSLIKDLIAENKELKTMMIEQSNKMLELVKEGKYITNNTTNNTTNNITNKFNLNIFLNEKCKDALNLNDFVNSLELKLTDLEETGRIGYSEGISKIFIRGLKELDVYKRPIHCSDAKREILYIKDNDIWEKENDDKTKIKMAIKEIGNKNIKQIPLWVKKNPQCKDYTSKKNDEYMLLLTNTMIGGSEEEGLENMEKIIKNVSKEVVIEKN
jgi:hypothetical protein